MTNIYLHGMLGRKFGKLWTLDVESVKEAVRAIDINVRGKLREYWIGKGKEKQYSIKIGDYKLSDEKELSSSSMKGDIHIIPVIKGSKTGGQKIFAAIAMIAVAYFTGGFGAEGWIETSGAWGEAYMGMAISLALGGVMQLLTPIPNFNQGVGNDGSGSSSNLFQGNASSIMQGGAVPVVYGRILVSPMPVGISLVNSNRVTSAPPGDSGCIETIELQGKYGQQYMSAECP